MATLTEGINWMQRPHPNVWFYPEYQYWFHVYHYSSFHQRPQEPDEQEATESIWYPTLISATYINKGKNHNLLIESNEATLQLYGTGIKLFDAAKIHRAF